MPREDEEVQSAFEEQAGTADGSRELCDLFGLDAGGTAAARRDRILSLVDGPPSRRRWGWLDLLRAPPITDQLCQQLARCPPTLFRR